MSYLNDCRCFGAMRGRHNARGRASAMPRAKGVPYLFGRNGCATMRMTLSVTFQVGR